MKRRLLILGFCMGLFCCGCGSQKGKQEPATSPQYDFEGWSEPDGSLITDQKKTYTDPPESWPVTETISQQGSNCDGKTDAYPYVLNEMCIELDGALYSVGVDAMHLSQYDKQTKMKSVVCSRPDCDHSTQECVGYSELASSVQAYQGKLYMVSISAGEEMGDYQKYLLDLYAVNPDGSRKDKVQTLLEVETEKKTDDITDSSIGCHFFIHKGYVYFWYLIQDSRSSYDTWRNGNACLYRTKLGAKPGEEECVFAFPKLGDTSDVYLRPYGDYIYCAVSDNPAADITGTMYRFNLREKKTERLSLTEKAVILEIFPKEDELIYTAMAEDETGVVKRLDLSTGESQVIYDFTKETGLSLDGLSYDGTYWYIASYTRAENGYSIISQDYYVLDEGFHILGSFSRPENVLFMVPELQSVILWFNEWGGIAAWVDKSGFEKGDFTVHMK